MLYAEPRGLVCLQQSFLGALLRAEHRGKSVTCSTVVWRQFDRSLERFARLRNSLQGESRSAERRPRLAVVLVRCNELARMRVGGFVASCLVADACQCKACRAKSRIERQCAFQLRDALWKGATCRQQQREVRAELCIARRELDAAGEQLLGRIELPESMLRPWPSVAAPRHRCHCAPTESPQIASASASRPDCIACHAA